MKGSCSWPRHTAPPEPDLSPALGPGVPAESTKWVNKRCVLNAKEAVPRREDSALARRERGGGTSQSLRRNMPSPHLPDEQRSALQVK